MKTLDPFAPEVRARATMEYTLRDGRTKVTDAFLDVLVDRVVSNLRGLPAGVICRSCHLWGVDTWEDLHKGQRQTVGKAIVFLVQAGRLPLVFVSCDRCNVKRYRRL